MIKALLIGGGVTLIGMIGVGALGLKSAVDLDYRGQSEQDQQRFLDGVAKGFSDGFAVSAGDQAKITYLTASAANDTIAADIKFANPAIEQINGVATENLRKQLFSQYCNYLAGEKLNDSGVTLKLRLMRPSGAPITTVLFNEATCAAHKSARG